MAGKIYVGIGGWTFEPWRGVFYPEDLTHKRELEYASRKLTSIEINGTYYSSFKPASWAKWRAETPDGFVFAMKASRFCTNRRVLAEAGESIQRYVNQGLVELGDRLGPINWQFMAHQEVRSRGYRGVPETAAAPGRQAAAAPCAGGAARQLQGPALLRSLPQVQRRHRLCPRRGLPRDRRAHGGLHLRPPDGRPGEGEDGLQARRHRQMGQAAPRRGPRKATPSSTSSPATRCAIRPPRRR